ncbi:MAG: hypothetical protein N5P05_000421 [Chroococcopsis gigantea SAG 12.99]|jgi:predicted glutamine amidotransferase|nr:hypothetical protein [Chroococcopsis gigantea SAG 12.99]
MCRMILALGNFCAESVFNAALAMSEGIFARHEKPIPRHPNGWGAVWRKSSSPDRLSIYRDIRSLGESMETMTFFKEMKTDFLAIHVRHATLTHNQGIECTHPVTAEGTAVPWYLLHNGFLPTIYRHLGREKSLFDSREYFDFIVPREGDRLSHQDEIVSKLEALEPGGSSANAIVINPHRAYAIHWFPRDTPYPQYFTMHQGRTQEATFISSEPIPFLTHNWSALIRGQILEFPLQPLPAVSLTSAR